MKSDEREKKASRSKFFLIIAAILFVLDVVIITYIQVVHKIYINGFAQLAIASPAIVIMFVWYANWKREDDRRKEVLRRKEEEALS